VVLCADPFHVVSWAATALDEVRRDCASLDEALEVAAKHPVAALGAVDVRPFWE